MHKLVSSGLWAEVSKWAKLSRRRSAAVAYATNENGIRFGKGDLLIVNASDQSIATGQTSVKLLQTAFHHGADVFSCPNLHAKVLLLDEIAVVGSANLSASSRDTLIEAGLVTDHPRTVGMVAAFLKQLQQISDRVDGRFLKRVSQIKVNRTFFEHANGRREINVMQPRIWLVSVTQLSDKLYEDERADAERGLEKAEELTEHSSSEVSWIRFTGASKFRREAKPGDSVIQIWRSEKGGSPSVVYKNQPILRRQDEESCTRFYVEEFKSSERTALNWKSFQTLARRIGLPEPTMNTIRELSADQADALFSLWSTEKPGR